MLHLNGYMSYHLKVEYYSQICYLAYKLWRILVIYVTFVQCLVHTPDLWIFVPFVNEISLWLLTTFFFFSFRRVTIRTINSKSLNTFKLSHIKSWAHTDYSLSPRHIKRTQSSQVSANAIFLQLQRNLHDLYLLHRNFADADDFYISSLLISSLKWVKNIPKIIREVSCRKMALAEKQQIIEKNKMSRWTNIFLSLW